MGRGRQREPVERHARRLDPVTTVFVPVMALLHGDAPPRNDRDTIEGLFRERDPGLLDFLVGEQPHQ